MARVEEVLGQMELVPHRRTLIGNLSGGQIKRVSLGAELLARPSLLYIDEATSGLDAGTEARMMVLFRQLADDGKSVVCITHNVDNVDRSHLVLVLASGQIIFCGPPHDAPAYFGVKRHGQIYDKICLKSIDQWIAEFRETSLYDEFIKRRLDESHGEEESPAPSATPIQLDSGYGTRITPPPEIASASSGLEMEKTIAFERPIRIRKPAADPLKANEPAPSKADRLAPAGQHAHPVHHRQIVTSRSNWYQFRVLTQRYIELLWRVPKSLRLVLLQAPIVGLILAVGLIHLTYVRKMPFNVHLDDSQRNLLAYLHVLKSTLSSLPPTTTRSTTRTAAGLEEDEIPYRRGCARA